MYIYQAYAGTGLSDPALNRYLWFDCSIGRWTRSVVPAGSSYCPEQTACSGPYPPGITITSNLPAWSSCPTTTGAPTCTASPPPPSPPPPQTCSANFIPVPASGSCPATHSCRTVGNCCGSCSGSDGQCYAYTFGTTCSNTPISCPDLFDPLPSDETGSRPIGSCPAWRPYQTTTGCCGACRTTSGTVMAYDCGSFCSTSPGPGCSSTVPGTSAPPPPSSTSSPPPPSSTSSPQGLSVGGPSDGSWIIGVSIGVPIFLAIGLSVGGLLVCRKRKAYRAVIGHAVGVTSVAALEMQPNPASPSATEPSTSTHAVPATAVKTVPATSPEVDGQPVDDKKYYI